MLTLIGCLIFEKTCRKFCQYGCFQAVKRRLSIQMPSERENRRQPDQPFTKRELLLQP